MLMGLEFQGKHFDAECKSMAEKKVAGINPEDDSGGFPGSNLNLNRHQLSGAKLMIGSYSPTLNTSDRKA